MDVSYNLQSAHILYKLTLLTKDALYSKTTHNFLLVYLSLVHRRLQRRRRATTLMAALLGICASMALVAQPHMKRPRMGLQR